MKLICYFQVFKETVISGNNYNTDPSIISLLRCSCLNSTCFETERTQKKSLSNVQKSDVFMSECLVNSTDTITAFTEECIHCCLRAEDLQYGHRRPKLLQANHSCVEMKGQFVRLVTLNCSPPHPGAFILLTPAPRNCHADPLRVFMSLLCLWLPLVPISTTAQERACTV